ncbi:hypothetical protein BpHYR1_007377 [Brachionus plicatilis]|uniref:Uncharacterized protein n=1 Tax=Brachionus plicatilis TaxID=10195 RepID=A0A3M7P1Y5_BRAPC|nr:hypothetical protein BpHYR1_007377 [Brachionus plicatilis]
MHFVICIDLLIHAKDRNLKFKRSTNKNALVSLTTNYLEYKYENMKFPLNKVVALPQFLLNLVAASKAELDMARFDCFLFVMQTLEWDMEHFCS